MMKKRTQVLIIAVVIIMLFGGVSAWANSAPVVSSVTAGQRTDGSGIVDVYYTLSDADGDSCTVSIVVSDDGGSSWNVAASSFVAGSDIGAGISSGRRHIIWNSKTDLPGAYGTNYRLKVTADDGSGPDGMVWVYINDSGAGMKDEYGNPISHGGFTGEMSKYETTNAQYCEFLNAALASGDVVVDGTYVKGANGSNSGADFVGQVYYYLAGTGYTYNGTTNGGAARINWTGSSFTVDSGFENHPVTYVSWYGSTAFASYYGWRLPTEWEWQAVADFNGSFTYGCGTTINNSIANYYNSTHPDGTTVVGSFGTYGYGMCDMAGNIWEWTSTIIVLNEWDYSIHRSGCWQAYDYHSKVSYRDSESRLYATYYHIGFRVCR